MQKKKIRYGLKNDYMFRSVLQSNEKILCGLSAALLGLDIEEIKDCRIENPIILGEDIEDKTCVLDIKILLNHCRRLNIELQTRDYGNWSDRSLLYLCRAFDDLSKGEKYEELKETVHVGILDFTLFPEDPEFYAEFLLRNTRNFKIYNSKFVLRVLDLTQTEYISEEEKDSDLYYWAKLFLAESWEEIDMLAEKQEVFAEAAATMHKMDADARIRMQCEAQERFEHDLASAYGYGMKIGEQRGRELGLEQGLEYGVRAIILDGREEGLSVENIRRKIQKYFSISSEKADEYIKNMKAAE